IKRLIEYTVFSGFVTAWRFATWPTRRSPDFVIATTEGVVRAPSWLGITTGSPPCMTATTEFVVPRSIPIILLIVANPFGANLCGTRLHHCPPGSDDSEANRPLVPNRGPVYKLSASLSSFFMFLVN